MPLRIGFYARPTKTLKSASAAVQGALILSFFNLFAHPQHSFVLAGLIGALAGGGGTWLLYTIDEWRRKREQA